jgi:hypothetical protein
MLHLRPWFKEFSTIKPHRSRSRRQWNVCTELTNVISVLLHKTKCYDDSLFVECFCCIRAETNSWRHTIDFHEVRNILETTDRRLLTPGGNNLTLQRTVGRKSKRRCIDWIGGRLTRKKELPCRFAEVRMLLTCLQPSVLWDVSRSTSSSSGYTNITLHVTHSGINVYARKKKKKRKWERGSDSAPKSLPQHLQVASSP